MRQAGGEGPAAVAQMTVARATAEVAASGAVAADLGQAVLAAQAGEVAQVDLAAEAVTAGPAVLVSSAVPASANMQYQVHTQENESLVVRLLLAQAATPAA